MGAVVGLMGIGGGDKPKQADTIQVTNGQNLGAADVGVRDSLAQQQALLQALQGQGGLANQSQVYGQLQGVAQGAGPNPAQMQFENNLNQIAAQQAGAIASQKGISPAIAARLISQQAGMAKQNAAGAGAEALANQQLNAMSAAGSMANQQASNLAAATAANTQANLNNQANLFGAAGQANNAAVSSQNNINDINFQTKKAFMDSADKTVGTIAKASGDAATAGAAGAAGGMVPGGPKSMAGQHFKNYKGGGVVAGKAKVSGDSYSNDTVNAKLSPKEIVLPRSVTMSKDPIGESAKFVAAVLAKKGIRK